MRSFVPALLCLAALPLLQSCAFGPASFDRPESAIDLHSYGNPDDIAVRHVAVDLELDFEARVVRGTATLDLDRRTDAKTLMLDTQDLTVQAVENGAGTALPFSMGLPDPILGAPLAVTLGADDVRVRIRYETSPDAAALQWLQPSMTRSGKHPYLYTQGQAILTRSWIPLQDSPGVRVTYRARIRAPQDLVVVMSSMERGRDGDAWTFGMPKAVPPYLIALACGEIEKRELDDRCAVYAEPDLVDEAAREFEDTPAMLKGCEELFGPYRWGRYDILVLPPAFPFGGMENPCLTFATPTILAGDKSLVALIAHELAHSWSGNLVTNATWRDFWLNEGFTVYLEQRIMEHVFGPERARMEILLELRGLRQEMLELRKPDQILHLELAGRNPDDGMTGIAYVKGATFLRRLEEVYGRERFDAFLSDYFDNFAFQSITTGTFMAWLRDNLIAKATDVPAGTVDVNHWVGAPGLPSDAPEPTSGAFEAVDADRAAIAAGDADAIARARTWNTQQWLHYLAGLDPATLEAADNDALKRLDGAFKLTTSRNAEVLSAWLVLAIRADYRPAALRQKQFLMSVGRRKFLTPQYRALLDAGKRERALAIYKQARPRYHTVATRTLDELLGWKAN